MRQHTSTRLAAAAGLTGAHAALWLTAPRLSAAITLIEIALTVTVILTALYAPEEQSARAFRMLPWMTHHPTNLESYPSPDTGRSKD